MIHVLHVTSSLDPIGGGVSMAVAGMAEAQAVVGLNVHVASTWVAAPGGPVRDQIERAGARVTEIQAFDPRSQHPRLRAMLDDMIADADVVHIHAMWEEIQHHAARAAQDRNVPYFVTPHGMLDPWNMSKSTWKKKLYIALRSRRNLNRAAGLHFTTEIEREVVNRLRFKAPTIVEPLGIKLEEFEPLPPRGFVRDRFAAAIGDRFVLMFLGRIHAGKGLELLVPALAKLKRGRQVLVVVGPDSGGYQSHIETMARSLGVRDEILFTGIVRGAERVKVLVDADLLVLPSFHENFGLAAAEALAAGVPVVVSDQVNIHREISGAGVGGVVPTKADSLARELAVWIDHPEHRATAASKARAFVWDRYDRSKIAGRWVEHYERACRVLHETRK